MKATVIVKRNNGRTQEFVIDKPTSIDVFWWGFSITNFNGEEFFIKFLGETDIRVEQLGKYDMTKHNIVLVEVVYSNGGLFYFNGKLDSLHSTLPYGVDNNGDYCDLSQNPTQQPTEPTS